jgi:DNA-binding NtrC family response regulator
LKNPQSYKPFVVAIVATLQERKEDLPLFTDPYLRGFYQNIPQKRLLPVTIAAMTHYTRPDNVYKLENPMKRLAIITEDENISVENLPENTCRTSSFPNTT